MLHIYTILLWLLQTETGIVDEVVHEDWLSCLLYPDRTTLLVLGTAPATVDDGVVIGGHLRERNHLAIASIRKLEGVGAGVVDDVVGYIELATRLHVDGLTTIGCISAIGKDIVDNHAVTTGKVSLVVVVVMEETVGHHKLAVHITEVEGWHTAIDGGLEKLVLERS